jgi:hypothetical protein
VRDEKGCFEGVAGVRGCESVRWRAMGGDERVGGLSSHLGGNGMHLHVVPKLYLPNDTLAR